MLAGRLWKCTSRPVVCQPTTIKPLVSAAARLECSSMPKRKAAAVEVAAATEVSGRGNADGAAVPTFTAPALVLDIDVGQYQIQLDSKVAKVKALFADLAMPEPLVHTSPPINYRMRAEMTVFHKDNDMYYVMFDSSSGKKPPPRVRVDHFPVATKLVNELMEIVRRECLADPVLKSRLFQVNFHTTLSGQAMLSMLYHSPLKENWQASAKRLRLALAQAPSFIPGGPSPASGSASEDVDNTAAPAVSTTPAQGTAEVQEERRPADDGDVAPSATATAEAATLATVPPAQENGLGAGVHGVNGAPDTSVQVADVAGQSTGSASAAHAAGSATVAEAGGSSNNEVQPSATATTTVVGSNISHDSGSRDGGPTASTSAALEGTNSAAGNVTETKPAAATASAAVAKPCMSRLPHIIGRSRKQKVCLDSDYVIERLQVHGVSYEQQQVEGAFSQPNGAVCQQMLEWAQTVTEGSEEWDLLELYCGNGNFTIPLATNFRRVIATEVSKSSVDAARHNLAAANLPPSRVFVARMSSEDFAQTWRTGGSRRRLADIDLNTLNLRTILVDPPRAGLDPFTLELVAEFEHIVYISCNPETLHANLTVLSTTHRVERFAVFDQFPYTPHLETGVYLVRKAATEREGVAPVIVAAEVLPELATQMAEAAAEMAEVTAEATTVEAVHEPAVAAVETSEMEGLAA